MSMKRYSVTFEIESEEIPYWTQDTLSQFKMPESYYPENFTFTEI